MATITKRGGRWVVQVRRKGLKSVNRTFPTKPEADKWARQIEGRMASDDWTDLSEAKRTTLAEALRRYEAERTPAKKGAKQEHLRIAAWLKHELAARPLGSVRSQEIAAYRTAMVKAGKAPTTIRNALTIISQVYELARTEWGMPGLVNPVRGVRMPKARQGRDRRLEPGEEPRLFAACQEKGIGGAVRFAIETAMRQGELLALRWCDVKGNVAHVRDSKTGDARSVPLSSRALAVLKALPASLDRKARIFPWSAHSLDHRFRRACQAAEIVGLRWHDLRHEAVSRLFERNLDALEVASVSGHKTLAMLKRYTHHRAERLAAKLG